MNLLIILAHPTAGSFNHAIAEQARQTAMTLGHTVTFHDLCAERFDPLLPGEEIPRDVTLPEDLAHHCQELSTADGIIIVHPNWWGMPPAILTGWVDRVVRPGMAYEFVEGDSGEGVPVGLLKAKKALVFNTSNTEANREKTIFGDPLERIWKDCIFGLCGVRDVTRKMFRIIVTSTDQEREQWLENVATMVAEAFPANS